MSGLLIGFRDTVMYAKITDRNGCRPTGADPGSLQSVCVCVGGGGGQAGSDKQTQIRHWGGKKRLHCK